jgi:hypothetical protein
VGGAEAFLILLFEATPGFWVEGRSVEGRENGSGSRQSDVEMHEHLMIPGRCAGPYGSG